MHGPISTDNSEKTLNTLLEWWANHMIDDEHGGFVARIDGAHNKQQNDDKSIILNTRILWTFSTRAALKDDQRYIAIATRAYEYISNYFWDSKNGGVFWAVNYKGQVVDDKKQVYAQAFMIYALSAYYYLTKKSEAAELAMQVFDLIESHCADRDHGGYYNVFTQDWTLVKDQRLSEKDIDAAKIMNTHLHVLEAYTLLYHRIPSDKVRTALENCVDLFLTKFYNAELDSLNVYFDTEWRSMSSHRSFGHEIEASWLLWEAAIVLNDEVLKQRILPVSLALAESVLVTGISDKGAVYDELETDGTLHKEIVWWVQAEAVVGFWNAFQLSGKRKFAEAAMRCYAFIEAYIADNDKGEWHWQVDEQGTPDYSKDQAGPWKGPYHNGRMCLELLDRLSSG